MNRHRTHKLYRHWSGARHFLRSRPPHGHGIHSPFLYRFVTGVLDNPWPYYDFERLDRITAEQGGRSRERRYGRLLFRIAQDLRPDRIRLANPSDPWSETALGLACGRTPRMDLHDNEIVTEKAGLILLNRPGGIEQRTAEFLKALSWADEQAVLLVADIHEDPLQRLFWNTIRKHGKVRASIDLHQLGLLFLRPDLPATHLRIRLKR